MPVKVAPLPVNHDLSTPEGREAMEKYYMSQLVDSSIPFWLKYGPDKEKGGFFTAVGRNGELLDDDKSCWFQGRAGWMFATLYNTVEKKPEWLQVATSCCDFIDAHCCDKSDSDRMYFTVTRDGAPLRKRRYAFSECFAAVANAALYGATGDQKRAQAAIKFWELYTAVNFGKPEALAAQLKKEYPAKTDPKTRNLTGMAPRMITLVTAQELRQYLPKEHHAGLNAWIDQAIHDIRTLFIRPEYKAVVECVEAETGKISDHFDGRTINPGHAIEGSWFIMHEGKHRGGAEGAELIKVGLQMLDWMWEWGWDKVHGGILYFRDVKGLPPSEYWQDMKFWWPHNEAIIATTLAFQLTGDTKYSNWHKQVQEWADAHFVDKEHGDWYGYLHRDGSVSVDLKGNMWKGPFHFPRQLWYCAQLLKTWNVKQ